MQPGRGTTEIETDKPTNQQGEVHVFPRNLVYMGHVNSGEGIYTDPDNNIAAVRERQTNAFAVSDVAIK